MLDVLAPSLMFLELMRCCIYNAALKNGGKLFFALGVPNFVYRRVGAAVKGMFLMWLPR